MGGGRFKKKYTPLQYSPKYLDFKFGRRTMNVTMKRVCPTCAWIAMDTLQLKNSTLIKLTAKVYLEQC